MFFFFNFYYFSGPTTNNFNKTLYLPRRRKPWSVVAAAPRNLFPQLPVLILNNRNTFTWHYVKFSQWKELQKTFIPNLYELSSYRREIKTVRRMFVDLMLLYPWLKFKRTFNWDKADIRFSYFGDTDERSHVHIDKLPADIHLSLSFWKSYTKYQYSIMFHEVQHLLGNDDNNEEKSIMSGGGVYVYRRPFYRDVLTTTYMRFKDNFRRHVISFNRFKVIRNGINAWTKRYDASLNTSSRQ